MLQRGAAPFGSKQISNKKNLRRFENFAAILICFYIRIFTPETGFFDTKMQNAKCKYAINLTITLENYK
jgi:hypothetical protein